MTWILHFLLKVNPPLLLQCLMQPATLWEHPAFQLHILGRREESDERLQRPWAGSNVLEAAARSASAWEEATKKRDARAAKMLNGMRRAPPKDKAKAKAK